MDTLVPHLVEEFKRSYGLKITDGADMFLVERNLLKFLMRLGRGVMGQVFQASVTRARASTAIAGRAFMGCLD